jgi:hypothetical protein
VGGLRIEELVVTERIVEAAGSALGRRTSRRGLLARAALIGSALSVSPLQYLIRPLSAWAVIAPNHCKGGLCSDGWTAFCCEIYHGANSCPPNSYVAGWWKCTAYRGRGICAREGVRYYVDCNRTPGTRFRGGCRCANNNCNERRVDCNHFRYGQCNAQVGGITEVACRLVVCEHPASISTFNCNSTYKVDNRTCAHEGGCREPAVHQVAPGGGV